MNSCPACGSNINLRKSHIIPEWAYDYVYTSKHRFAAITESNRGNLKVEQKGFRELMLCQNCETYLSRLENELKGTIEFLRTTRSDRTTDDGITLVYCRTGISNYELVKKAVLSILWRMSVSRLPTFAQYDLMFEEAPIHDYVFSENATLPWYIYPIAMSRTMTKAKNQPGLMILFKRNPSRRPPMFQLVIAGFLLNVFMIKQEAEAMAIGPVVIHEDGSLFLDEIDSLELMAKGNLVNRFLDKDVNDFFQRHK